MIVAGAYALNGASEVPVRTKYSFCKFPLPLLRRLLECLILVYLDSHLSTTMVGGERPRCDLSTESTLGKSKEDESGVRKADDQGLGYPTVRASFLRVLSNR